MASNSKASLEVRLSAFFLSSSVCMRSPSSSVNLNRVRLLICCTRNPLGIRVEGLRRVVITVVEGKDFLIIATEVSLKYLRSHYKSARNRTPVISCPTTKALGNSQ